jgi:PAT family beta-lactamase induction signal transducer AmpG
MYGSKYLGTAIGGGGLSILVGLGGLHAAFAGMIVLVAAIALLPLLTVEHPGQQAWPGGPIARGDARPDDDDRRPDAADAPTPRTLDLLRSLAGAFSHRAAIATGVVALLATTASGMLSPIGAVLFVKTFGWSQAEYGAATGGAAVVAGLLGAVIGGFLADAAGPRRLVAMCSVLLAVLLVSFGVGMESDVFRDRTIVWSYLVAESALLGCINAAFFAVCFGVCRPIVAATQFTAYMALMNLGVAAAQGVAGDVESAFGVSGAWILAGVIQFSVALLMPLTMLSRRIADRHARESA